MYIYTHTHTHKSHKVYVYVHLQTICATNNVSRTMCVYYTQENYMCTYVHKRVTNYELYVYIHANSRTIREHAFVDYMCHELCATNCICKCTQDSRTTSYLCTYTQDSRTIREHTFTENMCHELYLSRTIYVHTHKRTICVHTHKKVTNSELNVYIRT